MPSMSVENVGEYQPTPGSLRARIAELCTRGEWLPAFEIANRLGVSVGSLWNPLYILNRRGLIKRRDVTSEDVSRWGLGPRDGNMWGPR